MSPSERAAALLSSANQSWVVGSTPAQERPVSRWLKKAIQQGLLGLVLVGASLASPASEATGVPSAQSAAPDRQATVALIAPVIVPTALERRAHELPWVLPNGQVDGAQLISTWRKGGVSPSQAAQLLNVLVLTQSPVVAQTAAVRDRAARQTERTAGILNVLTAQQATAFLETNNLEALAWEGVVHSSEAMNVQSGEGFTWPDVEAYWHRLSPDRADEANSEARVTGWGIDPNKQDMKAAREALVNAVRDSGLAGVRIPLPVWNDSANVATVAERIQESNAVLQDVTGWNGPVLGLNGRVEWTIYSPLNLGATFYRGPLETVVLSGWEDLPHEWFHALDYALRSAPVDLDTAGGATLTQQWGAHASAHSHQGHDLNQSWGSLHDRLRSFSMERGDAWFKDRDARVQALQASRDEDDQWRAGYLRQTHETIAFAWQAYVQTHLSHQSASWTQQATDGRMGPREQEALAMAPIWKALLQDVNTQWWSTQYRTVRQWRAERQSAEAAATVSKAPAGP